MYTVSEICIRPLSDCETILGERQIHKQTIIENNAICSARVVTRHSLLTHTADTDKTRRDSFVLSVSAV